MDEKEQEILLGGNDRIVEVDETLVARRKYNRGRIVEQKWLFGMINREGGDFILRSVDKRDSETLGSIIKQFISTDSIVCSDMWSAYMSFFNNNGDYTHKSVNHSRNFVSPEDRTVHTQNIENL